MVGKEEGALNLWKRWFEYSGDPWVYCGATFNHYCLFCDGKRPDHKPGCVYIAAKKLVEHKADDK